MNNLNHNTVNNKLECPIYTEFKVFNPHHILSVLFDKDELSSSEYALLYKHCVWHVLTNSKVHPRVFDIALQAEYYCIELAVDKEKAKEKLKKTFSEFNAANTRYANKFIGMYNNFDKEKQ